MELVNIFKLNNFCFITNTTFTSNTITRVWQFLSTIYLLLPIGIIYKNEVPTPFLKENILTKF